MIHDAIHELERRIDAALAAIHAEADEPTASAFVEAALELATCRPALAALQHAAPARQAAAYHRRHAEARERDQAAR
jgi:hypothetical protein